jgi:hypothetical protein
MPFNRGAHVASYVEGTDVRIAFTVKGREISST